MLWKVSDKYIEEKLVLFLKIKYVIWCDCLWECHPKNFELRPSLDYPKHFTSEIDKDPDCKAICNNSQIRCDDNQM